MQAFRHCALAALLLVGTCAAAPGSQPPQPRTGHPRLLVDAARGRADLQALLARDADAARRYAALVARMHPYVDRHRTDPAWIVSRLQMYWQSHSTKVFVKNGVYDHAEGSAPVPTVRFTGTRDAASAYFTPKLEDVKPYMGERDLLWLQNRNAPGQPWEWVSQAKSGRIVEAINLRIANLARDAAFLYWATGDDAYARFAYDIFSTYMAGMAWREEPVDLNHGHDQTLLGLQSFETIHEDIVVPLTEAYDFMHGYVPADRRPLFDRAFSQWADLIVRNGVPWNNWNLIEARFILHIAAVLPTQEGDAYVRKVLKEGAARQWTLRRLHDHGYNIGDDRATGIWNESPGYSMNVANDFMECVELLDEVFGIDVLPDLPALPRAARALPQYLLPNGRTVGFGDSRYETPRTGMIARLLTHARRHGKAEDAAAYATLLATLRGADEGGGADPVRGLLEASKAPAAAPASVAAYQTPTFYAPNASWLVQRNGHAGPDAMAISVAGSSGNHAHANGIAMELYAQGLSLAPESGRGSGYLQNDHLEYYSQFPAHNTVVVDGVSAYPSMKSNHPFTLLAAYPAPGSPAAAAFPRATFGAVAFREPETDAEQQRVLGIVRVDGTHGYFVDIFRSRRRDGKDRYHDYLYHNLGQSLRFLDPAGQLLATTPSQRLSFADGDLIGYDYWRDRASLTSRAPLRARFDLQLSGQQRTMTAWLQGGAGREFFSLLAPPSTAWSADMLPREVEQAPLPTLVIRQAGEAWLRPFTAVFEPGDGGPAHVVGVEQVGDGRALALRVRTTDGARQTIFSGDAEDAVFERDGQRLRGRYGIAAERDGRLQYLFLGQGREIASSGYALSGPAGAAAALWQQDGRWRFSADRPVRLQVPAADWPAQLAITVDGRATRIAARRRQVDGRSVLDYALPAMTAAILR
ncbi:heparinase II/III family protein [Telluria sp. Tellsp104]